MAYELSYISGSAAADPAGFALECEAAFRKKVTHSASLIADNLSQSQIVLLSGPSGSGKTTTAKKLCDELAALGVSAHTVSLDNYFLSLDPETVPRTKTGDIDYESPFCLDLRLLDEHFSTLDRGEEITVPHFSFATQSRHTEKFMPLRLHRDEVAIFEGIHALNDIITNGHSGAFKLYISARSDVTDGGGTVFKGTWARLIRRAVRDSMFRSTEAQMTLSMWGNVRRGEKHFISPFKNKANYMFDSLMPYELPALKSFAEKLFFDIPAGIDRYDELRMILPALERFPNLDSAYIPPDSILREFIGGGIYKY
jgi:uridine kinase